ncbi:oxidoreductase [Parvibaculum sp.]|uniref:oxidoreductase n=1 Tax=Parvibaculum sp. TaxID=2024848 RepID=UPI003BAD3457
MPDTSRKWWITGVSSGLGKAIAAAALERGDFVAGTVRRDSDLKTFEAQAPGRALGVLLDITDGNAVRKAAAAVEERTGGIDILVNNAGYGLIGAIEEASAEEIRGQFEVNVFGAISVIQSILPFMRGRRRGHILNVTSVSGLAPWMGTGIYGATKYALECIGQTLAEEVRPLGIKVTNVAPGGLRTDFATRSLTVCKSEISDYEPTAHLARSILSGHGGNEGGDPVKAALAILKAVDAEEPPLHLLLGADALHYVGRKLGAFHAEIADWAPVTLSIAHDES